MRRLAFALLSAGALAVPVLAQQSVPPAADPPFTLVTVGTRQAKFGQQGAIEEYYVKLRAAEAKLNVAGLSDVYVVAQGGRGQQYKTIRTLKAWADLDTELGARSTDTLRRAYGEAEQQRLTGALLNATDFVINEVLRVRPGMSNWRDNNGGAWPFIAVRRDTVKPDMLLQHAAFVEKMRVARASSGAGPDLQWTVDVGPGFVQGSSYYFRTWAERDSWPFPLVKAYGQAEADRLNASRRQALTSTESYVLRHRPDLSRARAAAVPSRP